MSNSIPTESIIQSANPGVSAMMAAAAQYLGVEVNAFLGPGGVNPVDPANYSAGRRALKMLGDLNPDFAECFVHHLSEDDGAVYCTVFITRAKGEFKFAVTTQVPAAKPGPPKQYPYTLLLRYSDKEMLAMAKLTDAKGEDRQNLIRRLLREAAR